MAKRLVAKIGQYTTKDGDNKNQYTNIGVMLENQNGEYILIDPTVNLAGVLLKQRILAQQTGGKVGDSVMVSVFDNSNQKPQPHAQLNPTEPNDDIPF